ncbi:hypothetical protein NHL50_08545 [Acidimicrobiia bacterium EGI L10123]|uniref:hypothetical protein n=1 Tax=Salinilacustrithrix flava TaxID=2957203 RepID=UPI003D7C2C30|nr:hypothetical protein [Acidimicrobiia bacterium EGI L10123]
MTETIHLNDPRTRDPSQPCKGGGGYDDLYVGQQMSLTNESGSIVALGRIDSAEHVDGRTEQIGEGTCTFYNCLFHFIIREIPQRAFYEVHAAGRGGPTYSHGDLNAAGWRVQHHIG